jgi:hypothetical protein
MPYQEAQFYSFDDLKQAYPNITTTDIQACLLFAADNTKHEKTLACIYRTLQFFTITKGSPYI